MDAAALHCVTVLLDDSVLTDKLRFWGEQVLHQGGWVLTRGAWVVVVAVVVVVTVVVG